MHTYNTRHDPRALRLRDQLARLCGGEAHTEGGPRIHAEPAGGGGLAEGHHGNATMPHRHISQSHKRSFPQCRDLYKSTNITNNKT